MKIIHKEKSSVKLQIMSMDDLWYLSQLVEAGDTVSGKTERKIKLGDGEGKSAAVKKTFFVVLKVEKLEFHKYSNNLRINGKVTQGPEEIPLGSYHTFDVEPGTIITLEKEQWLSFQRDRLKEASKPQQPKVLIVTFDREEVNFALLRSYGYDLLSDFRAEVEKKGMPEKVKGNFYQDIAKQVEDYDKKYEFSKIILASPAFWKEYLHKEIKPELRNKVLLASCNAVGQAAIHEVLSRPEIVTALRDDRIVKETSLVEQLMIEIRIGGKAAYGIDQVGQAAEIGRVSRLLVTDSLIARLRQENSYARLDRIMKAADSQKGEITIISSEHEAGKRLDGIGGIGAVLRY